MVLGSRVVHNENALYVGFSNDGKYYCCRGSNKLEPTAAACYTGVNTRYNVALNLDNNNVYFNDTVAFTSTATQFTCPHNIVIFADNDNGSVNEFSKIRFFGCKLYNKNVLIRDFIPALDENDVACVYDRVEQKYYYNQGSGKFVAAPIGMQSLKYIGSTGTQYINTNLSVPNGYMARLNIEYPSLYQGMIVGARDAEQFGQQFFWGFPYQYNQYNYLYQFGLGDGGYLNIPSNGETIDTKYCIALQTFANNITLIINNNIICSGQTGTNDTGVRTANPLYIFALNNNGRAGEFLPAKLYNMAIYDHNSTLVRDYIPAQDGNGIVCLYDCVTKQYYYNQGTGSFYSNQSDSIPVNYLTCDGNQYINTGFVPDENTRVVFNYEILQQDAIGYYTLFSSRNNECRQAFCIYSQNVNIAPHSMLSSYGEQSDITFQYNMIGRHIVDANKNQISFDNIVIGEHQYIPFDATCELRLFRDNQPDGGDGHGFVGRLYSCKIYDNDILIRDYLPMIDYRGIACLYDRVEQRYYYNNGTGKFATI